jgi:hypothetical protein
MPNEIYPISHFGYSKDVGFGSIYHHLKNVSEEPEEPIVVTPPIVVVPGKPEEPDVPEEPEEPKKKEVKGLPLKLRNMREGKTQPLINK